MLVKRTSGAWESYDRRQLPPAPVSIWATTTGAGTPSLPSTVTHLRFTEATETQNLDPFAMFESSSPPQVFGRPLGGGANVASLSQGTHYDLIARGRSWVVAVVEAGDLKLITRGETGNIVQLPGPPRGGLPSPPPVLDYDTACETAWPRLGFVQDALVVTWQERCAAGPWKVYARVLR